MRGLKGFVLLFLLFSAGTVVPAAADSPDALLNEIRSAVDREFYGQALELLLDGRESYPDDSRFPEEEGDLYRGRELYNLALQAYQRAENLSPGSLGLKRKTASTLGFLDRNGEALIYLEELASATGDPDDLDDLGWMYYKTHQPEKGIPMLEEALQKNFSRSLSLTLGTLYSDLNDRENCRKYYLAAINDALENGDDYFASVGFYNLSLAEQSFYSYESAITYAERSIEQMNRSGGHLALGDLYLNKGDFDAARREILIGRGLDETPLSSLNLASLLQARGYLDEALAETDTAREFRDDSWMYYYGLNRNLFLMDLYRLYDDIFRGLYHTERMTPVRGIGNRMARRGRMLSYSVKSLYYRTQHRLLAFREGRVQLKGESFLRAYITLADAARGFRTPAVRYLRSAADLEWDEPLSFPWYALEIGRETGDAGILTEALEGFQEEWEVFPREKALRELLRLSGPAGRNGQYNELSGRLYDQNPGSLRQYGLKLAVYTEFSGPAWTSRLRRRTRSALKRFGLVTTEEYSGYGPVLRIHAGGEESWRYSVTDRNGRTLFTGTVPVSGGTRREIQTAAERLASGFFP